MILASFKAEAAALQLLMQHGGDIRGTNRFGFSCFAAAMLRENLKNDMFAVLLDSMASIGSPETLQGFSTQAPLMHWLCLIQGTNRWSQEYQIRRVLTSLIKSHGDINHRIRHTDSTSEVDEDEAYEKFLWSRCSRNSTIMELIAQSKAESPLEYAIVAGNEDIAVELVGRGCHFVGREIKLAVRFGLLRLFKEFCKDSRWESYRGGIGRTCLQLALRWGHEQIVHFLLKDGLKFGQDDVILALLYPGISPLSTETQIDLIRETPELEERQSFGMSLLELCCLKFSRDSVREILRQYPVAYDSGALLAIVLRALNLYQAGKCVFQVQDIKGLISRRTERNCDPGKENAAVLVAAMFRHPEVLRILVTPDTVCMRKAARLPRDVLFWILKNDYPANPFDWIEPTYFILECQDWVACSPLMGLATTMDDSWVNCPVSEDVLDHLLACSYEPDALTVVVAATRGNLNLVRRFQCLANWQSIVSIDNQDRPPWCPTALQVAASEGNEELVGLFLDAGVSVNEKPAKQPLGYRMPRTALQAAIDKGNPRLIDLFIEHRADINAPAAEDSGATALQAACIYGDFDLSLRLLELGADANAKGAPRRGRTALEGAAEHGRIDTIELLLNYGAGTIGPHREQYIKAVVHAERNQNLAAAALLKEHREWNTEDVECYMSLQSYEWCEAKTERR